MKQIMMALRNLNRQKKRTILLAGAIAFGLMIVTLINGFTNSFITNLSENFSHILAGHIFIEGVEKSETGRDLHVVRNDKKLLDPVSELNLPVTHITKRSEFNGYLIFEGNTLQQRITGVDWENENYLPERILILKGSLNNMSNRDGLILSRKVADNLNVEVDDRLLVKLKTYTGQQNVGTFTVAAISGDPGVMGSVQAYANLDYVRELLNMGSGEYMTVGMFLEDLMQIDPTADAYYAALQGEVDLFVRGQTEDEGNPMATLMNQVTVDEWEGIRYRFYTLNDILSEVQQIVTVLDTASIIILLILFIIIMVGITNTFRMIMLERTKEIGTMRALGMQRTSVLRLFLCEAAFLALGGVILGHAGAGVIMFVLSRLNWGMDSPLFILLKNGYMTFALKIFQVLLNVGLVTFLTLFAAFFPSRNAAKLEPADALRSTH